MSSNDAMIVARMGCTGSGKSLDVKSAIERLKPKRLLIWDAMQEYGKFGELVPSLNAMVAAMRSRSEFRLRYVPDIHAAPKTLAERFDVFCAVAFAAGDLTMVVEELQLVTNPGYAPPSWSNCTLRGRHQGLTIFGLSQRPAHVDKNFFSNATYVVSGRVNFADDVSCIANVLCVDKAEVQALRAGLDDATGWKHTDYIARQMSTGAISRGVVTVPGQEGRQAPAAPSAARVDQVAQPGAVAANDSRRKPRRAPSKKK